MSRIGKKQIAIPQGVSVVLKGDDIHVSGPKGLLVKPWISGIDLVITDSSVVVSPRSPDDQSSKRLWGLARALLAGMIKGVSVGIEKHLELSGVGYKAVLKGEKTVELSLGYSHTITVEAPHQVSFKVEKNNLQIIGADAEAVGQLAAYIRSLRVPEPYNASGVKYKSEVIRRKAGKKAAG